MAIRTRNRNRTCNRNRNRNRTRTRNRTCNRNRTFTRGRNFLEGHHLHHHMLVSKATHKSLRTQSLIYSTANY
jgi:hypothetical protein